MLKIRSMAAVSYGIVAIASLILGTIALFRDRFLVRVKNNSRLSIQL